MSRSTTRYTIRLFVLIVSMVFVGADLSVSAQNANSSTTMQEDTSMQNSNTSNTNRSGRRRRGRRRAAATNGAATEEPPQPTNVFVTDRPIVMPVQTGRCDPNAQEQTDLSGTYTGTANYAEGGLSGETTLTITGNNFTMTSGSTTQEGRITAVTTCNYTAVTMMFGKEQVTSAPGVPQPGPLPAVSLRARKVAGGLTLESVGGGSRQFSFSSAPAIRGGKAPRTRSSGGVGTPDPVGIKPPTR